MTKEKFTEEDIEAVLNYLEAEGFVEEVPEQDYTTASELRYRLTPEGTTFCKRSSIARKAVATRKKNIKALLAIQKVR